jgi:hypothetical protein
VGLQFGAVQAFARSVAASDWMPAAGVNVPEPEVLPDEPASVTTIWFPLTAAVALNFALLPVTVIPLITPIEYASPVVLHPVVSPMKITVADKPVQICGFVDTLEASTFWLKVIVIVSPLSIVPGAPVPLAIATDVATSPSCVAGKFAVDVHELADVLCIW